MATKLEFSVLEGETITEVIGLKVGSKVVHITTASGRKFEMYHDQECCESVYLEEIHGDVADIVGAPILRAEKSTNTDNPPEGEYSWLWTFYRLQTIKGFLQMRWLGASNGAYGEDVSFVEVQSVSPYHGEDMIGDDTPLEVLDEEWNKE